MNIFLSFYDTVAKKFKNKESDGSIIDTGTKLGVGIDTADFAKNPTTGVLGLSAARKQLLDSIGTTYAKVVYVNAATPSTATIFSLVNPPTVNDPALAGDANNLYIGTDSTTWTYSSGAYQTKFIVPSTEWNLSGTTTDAGSNKTSLIQRNGGVQVGTGLSQTSTNSFEVGPLSGSNLVTALIKHTLPAGRAMWSVQNTSNNAGFDLRAYGAGYSETWWGVNLAGKSAMFAFSDMYTGTLGAQSMFYGTNNTNRMVITNDGVVRITNAVLSNSTNNVSGPNGLGSAPTGGVNWQTSGGSWAWLIQNINAGGHGADFNIANTTSTGYAISVRVNGVSAYYVDGLRRTNFSGLIQQLTSQAIYLGVNNFASDTVGDTRLRTLSGSIIIETCTVANAGKGLGTWVTQPSTTALKNQSFAATAGQTAFTLSSTPSGAVLGYRNNVLLNSNAFTISGTTATYVPASNGNNALLAGDNVRFVYN